jgi:preprotein translocase subunit SecA
MILEEVDKRLTERESSLPSDVVKMVQKSILLQVLDQLWKEHIATLDLMRHTIVLRAYGQKDPLNEYKKEAFNMFSDMLDLLKERVTTLTCHMSIKQGSDEDIRAQEERQKNQKLSAVDFNNPAPVAPENRTPVSSLPSEWSNVSRNSPCPCGSGKKFKHCHGRVA